MQQLQELLILLVSLVGTFQLVTVLVAFLVAMPSFILHVAKENCPVESMVGWFASCFHGDFP